MVIANNVMSRRIEVTSRVPQGSILGPLLFLLVIDSITDLNLNCDIRIFTDDTHTVQSILSETDAENLQADLETLYEWVEANNMVFNGSKFDCMKYGQNSKLKSSSHYINPDYTDCIEDKDTVRDLGILLSTDGSYNDHIVHVIKAKSKF